jgi:gluconolactonase
MNETVALSSERDAVGKVQVDVVPIEPQVINPNGTLSLNC